MSKNKLIIFCQESIFPQGEGTSSKHWTGHHLSPDDRETLEFLREDVEKPDMAMISSRIPADKEDELLWGQLSASHAMGVTGIDNAMFSLGEGRNVYGLMPFGSINISLKPKHPSERDRRKAMVEFFTTLKPDNDLILVGDAEQDQAIAEELGIDFVSGDDFFGRGDDYGKPVNLRLFDLGVMKSMVEDEAVIDWQRSKGNLARDDGE